MIASHDENPLMNNFAYDMELPEGAVMRCGANTIAENILSQCEPNEFYINTMEAIMDHKRDGSAIPKYEKY